jgi:hypothetical protein
VIPATLEAEAGGLEFEVSPGEDRSETVSKTNQKQKAGSMVQVVEPLPSMYKTLGSNPNLHTHTHTTEVPYGISPSDGE